MLRDVPDDRLQNPRLNGMEDETCCFISSSVRPSYCWLAGNEGNWGPIFSPFGDKIGP